jgi:hypothetical protein
MALTLVEIIDLSDRDNTLVIDCSKVNGKRRTVVSLGYGLS